MSKTINIEQLLHNDFQKAANSLQSLQTFKSLENSTLLQLYSYYKQVTVGDNSTIKPSILDFKGQAKWTAWNKLKGMSKQTSQVKYIKLVARLSDNSNI